MKASAEQIRPLTGLRFLAAFYVFIFHIQIRWPLFPSSEFLTNFIGQGAVGMSLFFILSGFLLAYRYGNRGESYRNYLVNRFSRIYPVYVVAALLTLPWIGIPLQADSLYTGIKQIAAIISLFVVDALLLQAWFPQLFWYWNNSGSWSISVEAFCYVLLPFILEPIEKLSTAGVKRVAVMCYACAVLPGLSIVLFYGPNPDLYYSMPIYRLPEFILGVCTAILAQRITASPRLISAWQIGGMAFLIAYLGFIGNKLPIFIGHNWIVLPVVALTIFSTAHSFGVLSRVLSSRVLVYCGHVSYSFYSFQVVLLFALKSNHAELVASFPVFADNRALLAASFVVLMAMSAAGYHWIEEPARLWIKRSSRKNSVPELVPAAPSA